MDFDFSEAQIELQLEGRRFLEQECSTAHVRDFIEKPGGWSRGLWKQMADLGWMGMPFGEDVGGLGQGAMELALLLGELGRALAPVPYLSSVAMAGAAIQQLGSDEQRARLLPGIASGERIGTVAVAEDGGSDRGTFVPGSASIQALPVGNTWRLTGEKTLVLDAPVADLFVVSARTDDGERLFVVEEGARVTARQGFDLTRPVGSIELDGAAAELLDGPADGVWRTWVAATCAEMVGVAGRAVDMSVEYAKVREQFGRPIGSFQAVKHKLAEMATEVDAARAAAYYACWAVDTGTEDAELAVSVAKSYCSDACGHAGGEGIQVHGGIAYTWEHDMHLVTRRIKSLESFMGDAIAHRERIAALVL